MNRIIVIADNFQLIHKGHMYLLKTVLDKYNRDEIQGCYVCIAQEVDDILGLYEKESMLNKIINKHPAFNIMHIESLKMFKDIKALQSENEIVAVLVEPLQESYIRSNLEGLNVPVIPYKHNIKLEDLEYDIVSGDYQAYTQKVPQLLWDEFQNLKELYTMDKISEEVNMSKGKLGQKQIEELVRQELELQIENKNKSTVKISKQELQEMIKTIISEKLTGQEFNDMYDIKTDILKEFHKSTKSKWVKIVSHVGKKPDGEFILKLIGSGGVKINLVWGSNIENGDFILSTGATLVAGEEFSVEAYAYMIRLVEKSKDIMKFLNEIESRIDDISESELGEMDTPEPIAEPMPPMDMPEPEMDMGTIEMDMPEPEPEMDMGEPIDEPEMDIPEPEIEEEEEDEEK